MIIIAQCTDEKRDKPCRAEEMYISDLFEAQRRYYEAYADKAYILSGKYGLIHPWTRIQPYDTHIKNQASEEWQLQVSERCETIAERNDHVEIIAGKEDYGKRLEPWFDDLSVDYSYPFEGLGIGERTQAMIRQARKAENNKLSEYA